MLEMPSMGFMEEIRLVKVPTYGFIGGHYNFPGCRTHRHNTLLVCIQQSVCDRLIGDAGGEGDNRMEYIY